MAVAAAGPSSEWQRRVKMVAWSSVWLVVLAEPLHDTMTGHAHPAPLAYGLLGAFVGLYLTLMWMVSSPVCGTAPKLALLVPLTGIAVAGGLAFQLSWVFLFFFLSAAVACALPERRAIFGVAAVTAIDALIVHHAGAADPNGLPQIFGVGMAGLIMLFIIRLLRLVADLNAAREDLARLAVADERLRFARDLHDLLGHTLSLIVVKSEAVRRLVGHDTAAAARESGDIEMVSRQALAEVREAVTNYRQRSLEAELEGARLALSAAGIEITIHRPDERLPDTVESVLGWTVREGVTNVVRHSRGRHCDIELRHHDGMATLEILDDGRDDAPVLGTGGPAGAVSPVAGASVADSGAGAGGGVVSGRRGGGGGSGLRGLAERLAAAGGRLEAGRRPNGGFRLAVSVPVNADRRGAG